MVVAVVFEDQLGPSDQSNVLVLSFLTGLV